MSSSLEDWEVVPSASALSDGSASSLTRGADSAEPEVESDADGTALFAGVGKRTPWRLAARNKTEMDANGSNEQSVTTIAPTMIPARTSGVRARLK
jgi:hypothetical protein